MAWTTLTNSTTADADEVMGNFAFVYQNFTPFDTLGTITNAQFNLGTSSALWKGIYGLSISAQSMIASGGIHALSQVVAGTYTPSNTSRIVADNGAAISIGLAYPDFGQVSTDGRATIAQFGKSTGGDTRSQLLIACRDTAASMTGVVVIDGASGGQVMIGGNLSHSQPAGKFDVHVSSASSLIIGGTGTVSSSGRIDIFNAGKATTVDSHSEILIDLNNGAGSRSNLMLIKGEPQFVSINHILPSQTLDVLGNIYSSGEVHATSLTVSGNTIFSGTLSVAGVSTFSATVRVDGNYTHLSLINSATVNGTASMQFQNDAQQWTLAVFGGNSDGFFIRDSQVGTNTVGVYPLGKVSIGSHVASQTLDVSGTLAVTGAIQASSSLSIGGNLTVLGQADIAAQPELMVRFATNNGLPGDGSLMTFSTELLNNGFTYQANTTSGLVILTSGTYLFNLHLVLTSVGTPTAPFRIVNNFVVAAVRLRLFNNLIGSISTNGYDTQFILNCAANSTITLNNQNLGSAQQYVADTYAGNSETSFLKIVKLF